MIYLQEIFDDLAHGELSNLTLRQGHTSTLSEEYYPQIISHINLGLGKLYERFNIAKGKMYLHLHDGVTTYYLRKERTGDVAEMDDELYIEEDFDHPFKEDLIKVIGAYDELEVVIPINDNNCPISIMASEFDVMQIPVGEDLLPQRITLDYQASHPKIVLTPTLDPSAYKLFIPDYIKEALLFYVASRVYKPTGTNSSTQDSDKSMSYMQLYELACTRIEADGLSIEVNDTQMSFQEGGWV